MASGCQTARQDREELTSDPTEDLHQELLRQATEDYSLGDPKLPVATDALKLDPKDGTASNIQVFSFAMNPEGLMSPETPRFIAAILSTKELATLGLRKGMNYVLKITKLDNPASTLYVLVPDKDKAKMRVLTTTYLPDANHEPPPHLIRRQVGTRTSGGRTISEYVVGGCIDNCGSGHCGVTKAGAEFTARLAEEWNVKIRKP